MIPTDFRVSFFKKDGKTRLQFSGLTPTRPDEATSYEYHIEPAPSPIARTAEAVLAGELVTFTTDGPKAGGVFWIHFRGTKYHSGLNLGMNVPANLTALFVPDLARPVHAGLLEPSGEMPSQSEPPETKPEPSARLKAHRDLVDALENLHASVTASLAVAHTSTRLLELRERAGREKGPEVSAHNASLSDLLLRLPGHKMRAAQDAMKAFLVEEENHRL